MLIIGNGRLITRDESAPLYDDGAVAMDGSTIVSVGTTREVKESYPNAEFIDAKGGLIMPADEEELQMAMEDGVKFRDLLAPVKIENGGLVCRKMALLEERDESGRCRVSETRETVMVPANTVIVAVGEKVPSNFYKANGLEVNERGKAIVDSKTLMSSRRAIYVIGDGLGGPATAVEGIRDARAAAEAILGEEICRDEEVSKDTESCYAKKGILVESKTVSSESERCLKCNTVCENCVDVCPNRANISITVPGMSWVILSLLIFLRLATPLRQARLSLMSRV